MAALFVLVAVAVSVPILTHPLPPLTDYTNSLAGAYVISTIASDADLQRFYLIEWRVIPNLMMDLVVPQLHRFMSIFAAGQVFTLAAFALILSGTLRAPPRRCSAAGRRCRSPPASYSTTKCSSSG